MPEPEAAFDLDRFVRAQDPVLEQVRAELRAGRKTSHWMWFVFPQIAGLGHSDMARRYAIASLREAEAFLAHPVLGPRLIACAELVLAVQGRTARDIFGTPDDLKLHSSMTLFASVPSRFASVPSSPPVFADVLGRYFGGVRDPATVARLGVA